MPSIRFVSVEGTERLVVAEDGISVMQAAITNGVPDILAECGGAASCATCHVYVDEQWISLCGEPGDDENEMLDCVAGERRPNSRLSCQIEISEALDGLVIRTPETQS